MPVSSPCPHRTSAHHEGAGGALAPQSANAVLVVTIIRKGELLHRERLPRR